MPITTIFRPIFSVSDLMSIFSMFFSIITTFERLLARISVFKISMILRSFSTAKTSLAMRATGIVKAPSPAPISKTTSSGKIPERLTIISAVV